MASQYCFWLLLITVIHCGKVFPTAIAEKAYVRPNTSVPCSSSSQPCLTFNEYAQEVSQYFVDNTTFLFLPGTHELDVQLDLKNLSNISFIPSNEVNVTVQVLLSPSVNITWTNCDNIEVSGLIFILSGQFNVLPEPVGISSDTELIFQETTGFLTNLSLIGNGTRQFARCISSHVEISNLVATSTKAPILHASNSVVKFYGQNSFFDNNISTETDIIHTYILMLEKCSFNFSGNTSFVNSTGVTVITFGSDNYISGNLAFVNNTFSSQLQSLSAAMQFIGNTSIISGNVSFINNAVFKGGSQISLFAATCYIPGNVLFLQNDVHLDVRPILEDYTGGAAIFTQISTIFISGVASFTRNQAIAPMGSSINGGAIRAVGLSRVILNESSNVSFIENSATSGGALSIENSNLTMYGRVLFERNSAVYGGGAIIAISERDMITTITCSGRNIIFRNNTSYRNGGAIHAASGTNVELKDILFERNVAMIGGGAIYVVDSSIKMTGTLHFRNNTSNGHGGAIYADTSVTSMFELRDIQCERNSVLFDRIGYVDDSSINMTGTLYFVRNSAQRGGAMALRGISSKLLLTEPLTANFVENSVTMSGGAIFFDDNTSGCQSICFAALSNRLSQQNCPIQLSSRANIRLNFDNNTADIAGRVLYGGNLDTCRISVGKYIYDYHPLNTIASISNLNVNVNYQDNTTSNISSDPLQACICKRNSLKCNDAIEIETVRGREFTLQVVIVGQGMGAIPSAVRISLDNSVQLSSAAQRIQATGKRCTNISYSLFAESNATRVTLFPDDGPCRNIGVGPTLINIIFRPCPNGFIQNGSECVCEERLQVDRFKAFCNISDGSIEWISNLFWMGALYENDSNESTYEGLILHRGCPLDYCVATPVPITLDNLDIQCNHNHFGILCGSCKENYSIALGSVHCLPCSNNYLALILPFAVAGIALVAILLLLRMTVTIGTLNGLIFYANVIQANHSIFFPEGATNILTVFIAWLNLDLGIETCFYDGMTTYAYTWLQFLFPFYVWFLIGLIIVVSHYSRKLTTIFSKNPVAAFATLFLISYSKLLRTIIVAVSVAELEYPDGTNKIVWLYDGNVAYGATGSNNHLALVIFATLILVLLFIPYTLLLFCAHWLQALSHWRILSWLNKIKPFMDTYHAPYKKQTRYWTGLLLFVRLFLFAFDTINSELTPIVVTSITIVLAALAWMHMGIYENHFINILEAFFIINLCIFSVATYRSQTNTGTALWKKILTKLNIKKYFIHEKKENKDLPPDGHRQSFALTAPTQTSVELREPLLE